MGVNPGEYSGVGGREEGVQEGLGVEEGEEGGVLLLPTEEDIGEALEGRKNEVCRWKNCGMMATDYKGTKWKVKRRWTQFLRSLLRSKIGAVSFQSIFTDFAIILIDETRGHVLSPRFDRYMIGPRLFDGLNLGRPRKRRLQPTRFCKEPARLCVSM